MKRDSSRSTSTDTCRGNSLNYSSEALKSIGKATNLTYGHGTLPWVLSRFLGSPAKILCMNEARTLERQTSR
jgi:hypothetical protein